MNKTIKDKILPLIATLAVIYGTKYLNDSGYFDNSSRNQSIIGFPPFPYAIYTIDPKTLKSQNDRKSYHHSIDHKLDSEGSRLPQER